jgi:hypothetical protein
VRPCSGLVSPPFLSLCNESWCVSSFLSLPSFLPFRFVALSISHLLSVLRCGLFAFFRLCSLVRVNCRRRVVLCIISPYAVIMIVDASSPGCWFCFSCFCLYFCLYLCFEHFCVFWFCFLSTVYCLLLCPALRLALPSLSCLRLRLLCTGLLGLLHNEEMC